MFEESHQSNRYQITRNQKQNGGGNKLMSHFQNSSFLAMQEQLSMFIKNLPLIKFEQINSLNKLIEILIKQNQILGNKCQHNILTVKEMFSKHEELLRNNKDLKEQVSQKEKKLRNNSVNQQQIESYESQLNKISQDLMEKDATVKKLSEMTQELMEQNKHCLSSMQEMAEVFKMIGQRNFKRCGEKVKEWHQGGQKWEWMDLQGFERYIKEEKKRSKYTPKVKQTVQMFCKRLLKISQYVPASTLQQQFDKQVNNLLNILDDLLLLKKRNNANSQSRLTEHHDCMFFEGLLDKMMKERENVSITREEISGELASVRQELYQCKNHYQQYLVQAKLEFEQSMRKKDEQVVEKTQILQFYEQQKEQNIRQITDLRNKISQFEEYIKVQTVDIEAKTQQIAILQQKLEGMRSQGSLKENELRIQWEQNIKTYQYKLAQKQQLLEEEQNQKRNLRFQSEEEKRHLKLKLIEAEQRQSTMSTSAKHLSQTNQELQEYIQKLTKKMEEEQNNWQKQISEREKSIEEINRRKQKDIQIIRKLKDELDGCEKQKQLQAAYIKELEIKSKELIVKLKTLESKKNEQKTAKKEMQVIKKTVLQERKHSREVEQVFQGLKEDNQKYKQQVQRLKGIIREMKKELQTVYQQITTLKVIENDRQKLMIDMQKSDRIRQELLKQSQHHKGFMLKLQQENKGLDLQVKHYRNALNRIEALRM